jgi:tetratricopeptide (TPR) repeat protein
MAITAIIGMGGIGKTELALQYAITKFQRGTYPGGVCWVKIRSLDIGTQIVEYAITCLNLQLPDVELTLKVKYIWQHWQPQGDVLVVLDDVTDYRALEPYLPPLNPRYKILITTREQLGKSLKRVDIQPLDEPDALNLLTSVVDGEETSHRINQQQEDAKALCQWVGCLPLGLELIAHYLAAKEDLLLSEMLQRLNSKRLNAEALLKPEYGMTAEWGVLEAFELSWDDLDEDARQLGCLLSLFANTAIPWIAVEACYLETDKETLERWRDKGLIQRSFLNRIGEEIFQQHQLTREFFQVKQIQLSNQKRNSIENLKKNYGKAIVHFSKFIPERATVNSIQNPGIIVPHIIELIVSHSTYLKNKDLCIPFFGVSNFYLGKGLYKEAEYWIKECHKIVQERLGEEHPSFVTSLNNLAFIYQFQGNLNEAEKIYVRARALCKEHYTEENCSGYATILHNMGNFYASQQEYRKAEPIFQEALNLRYQIHMKAQIEAAQTLDTIGCLHVSLNQSEEAEPLIKRALNLRLESVGENHPEFASSLNSLGLLFRSQEKYVEAEQILQRGLELTKQLFGDHHLDVATSQFNLGIVYQDQGKYEDAKSLYCKALDIVKDKLEPNHSRIQAFQSQLDSLPKLPIQ